MHIPGGSDHSSPPVDLKGRAATPCYGILARLRHDYESMCVPICFENLLFQRAGVLWNWVRGWFG